MAKSSHFAYNAIRAAILDGSYPPETHLREAAIATEIGVSRTPVREALRRLAADGYVSFTPNQGAFVNPWSIEEFRELIAVRAELAGLAAAGAAQNAAAEQIERMADVVASMARLESVKEHDQIDERSSLNLSFHELIFENCGNRWLARLLHQTSNVANVQRAYYAFTMDEWRRSVSRYQELIKAFRVRDGSWANAIFKSHFLSSRDAVVDHTERHKAPSEKSLSSAAEA